jgi:hypothetical protein
MAIEECVITGNHAGGWGGGLRLLPNSRTVITRSTLSGNEAVEGGGGLYKSFGSYGSLSLERTILWGNCAGFGGDGFFASPGSLMCCAVDTTGLDWDEELEEPIVYEGEQVFTDPLFCFGPLPCGSAPTVEGDYTLAQGSPCLPENSPCGELIGALGLGCATPSSAPETNASLPPHRLLWPPSPNPSAGAVAYEVELPSPTQVRIQVFDVRGRLVDAPFEGRLPAGRHELTWNPATRHGADLARGIFYLRLDTGAGTETRKIVRLQR